MSFNHFHVHSSLSLLDGISKRVDLIKLAKSHGSKIACVTDHGSLANHISFYKDCIANNIGAALGIETYVAPDSRLNREYKTVDKEDRGDISKSSYHLTLIAKNRTGYQNLIKISSDAYRNGFYKKPRTDLEFLQQHKEGIVVLSGCLGSITSQYILAGQTDKAIEYINKYRYMFGEDFLIELMQHDIPAEKMVYDALAHIGQTYGIPLILTNDSHFTSKEDAKAQEAALNINNMKVTLNSPEHWSFDGSGYWFKTPQEMQEVINKTGWPQSAYDNTSWLADRIEDYAFETGKHIVPKFKDHSNRQWDTQESHQKLTMMAYQGLNDKGLTNEPTYIDRLKYELDVMERKDFSSYFLIIADIVDFMRRSGFPLSPGRGSAVGSLVCYATNITGANPLTWGVPFERFINEGRKDLPDVDTDISQRHRKEVIQYIVDRYGHDNVAIIATYQQMTVKSVIDKVGRVLGVPPQVRRELSKIIGHTDKDDKLADVLENNPKVQTVLDSVPLWTDICKRLEGNYSNQSQHAAGVVISNDPIINHVPLGRDTEDGFLTTQYDMNDVQALGLLKLDMLGLTTLDIIDDAKKLVKQLTGQNVEVGDLNDLEPYKLLSSGNYVSTFQGDSHGYRALARKLVPDKFEHIMAFTALYRPGPMMPEKIVDAKGHTTKGPSILDHYVERRHGREPPDVWHPSLQDVFQDTYGNCLYQEQVGEVAKRLAGFNPEEADQLRKAIGKKDQALFDKMTALLVEGGIRLGHSEELIRGIAQKLSGSARYSWGRGHSVAYGINTYTTALLEAKYPLAYYVALLNANVGEAEEMAKLLARIMQKGVSVQPPHINTSSDIFTTDGKNIYMGLSSVRQLGDNALQAIVGMRQAGPFQSFLDFCRRSQMVASRTVTKAVKENLIKAGAFAWDLSIPDADKLANVELLAKILKKKPHADDLSLALQLQLTGKEISGPERAEYEKAVLSFYVSGHPISSFLAMPSVFSEDLNIISVSQLKTAEPNMAVNLLGLLIEKEVRISKRNTPYLRLTVQDQFETTTCVIFQDDLVDKLSKTLPQSSIVLIAGVTEISTFKDGEIDLRVKDVTQLTHGIPVAGIRIDQTQPIQYYSQYFGVNSWHSIQALPSNKWLATFKTPIRVTAEHLEGFQKLNGMKLVLGRSEPWANPQ